MCLFFGSPSSPARRGIESRLMGDFGWSLNHYNLVVIRILESNVGYSKVNTGRLSLRVKRAILISVNGDCFVTLLLAMTWLHSSPRMRKSSESDRIFENCSRDRREIRSLFSAQESEMSPFSHRQSVQLSQTETDFIKRPLPDPFSQPSFWFPCWLPASNTSPEDWRAAYPVPAQPF